MTVKNNGYEGLVRRVRIGLPLWCLLLGAIGTLGLSESVSARTIAFGGVSGADWAEGCSPSDECITPTYTTGEKSAESGNTPGGVIDFSSRTGWISPEEADQTENIALGIYARGGTIVAPTVLENLAGELPKLVDGDPSAERTFQRKDTPGRSVNTLGVALLFDLGSQFGVSRIKFYPSPEFPDDYIRAFEVFINDGSEELAISGNPDLGRGIFLALQNDEPVVELIFEPQLVRYIKLASHTTVDFEIAEFEVYGAGFVPVAEYLTDIFDFGEELALWGNIRWIEESLGDSLRSRIAVRTRTGLDDTPVVFNRLRHDDGVVPWQAADAFEEGSRAMEIVTELDAEGIELRPALLAYNALSMEERNLVAITNAAYDKLGSRKARIHDDVTNWSLWSAPYSAAGRVTAEQFEAGEGGTKILSPVPRRYFQANIDFENDDLFSANTVGALSFDIAGPSLAEEIVAEISPRQTGLGEVTDFSYTVIPDMRPGIDLGFSSFEVTTPVRVTSISEISYTSADGTIAVEDFSAVDFDSLPETQGSLTLELIEDRRFLISFPRVESSSVDAGEMVVIRVSFTSPVLRAATAFSGRALPDEEDGFAQEMIGGNAADLGEAGFGILQPNPANLIVQVPLGGNLLINVSASPPVISPNDDLMNDTAIINYDITSLIGGALVSGGIYDLSGRLVKQVYDGSDQSGHYERTWDGTDSKQKLVPPGTYIFRVSVEADTGDEQVSGTIAVVY